MNLFSHLKSSTRIRRSWTGRLQVLGETPRTLLVPLDLIADYLDRNGPGCRELLLDPWFSYTAKIWPDDVEKDPWRYEDKFYYICNRFHDVIGGYRITRSLVIEQTDFLRFTELKLAERPMPFTELNEQEVTKLSRELQGDLYKFMKKIGPQRYDELEKTISRRISEIHCDASGVKIAANASGSEEQRPL